MGHPVNNDNYHIFFIVDNEVNQAPSYQINRISIDFSVDTS